MANTFIEQIRGEALARAAPRRSTRCCRRRRLAPSRQRPRPTRPLAGLHEDAERLERLIVKDYRQEGVKGHRERLAQNHRVRARLDKIQEVSRKLLRAYTDGEDECEAC